MKYYIGLDAHSTTCTFVVVNENGKTTDSMEVQTNEKALLEAVRSIKGKKTLAMEVSNISKWLFALLKDEVEEMIVCEPGDLHRKKGKKTDFLDGERLAQMLRGGFLKPVYHEDTFFYDLRRVVNSYRTLVWDMTAMKCRYGALYRSAGLGSGKHTFYSDITALEQFEKPTDLHVGQSLFVQINCMQEEKKRYQEYFEKLVKREKSIKALTTMPGISVIRACIIAAAVCSPERFENKHKYWSYCMLVSHRLQSGGKTYGHARVRARADLKEVYMGAAETVLKTQKPKGLMKHYDQLRSKGLEHQKAKRSLARKIAASSLRLMRTGESYNDELI